MSLADDIELDPSDYQYNGDTHPALSHKDTRWTTKDGKRLFIFEMSTRHIKNTIKHLEKSGFEIPYEMLRELHYRKTFITVGQKRMDDYIESFNDDDDQASREAISYNGDY